MFKNYFLVFFIQNKLQKDYSLVILYKKDQKLLFRFYTKKRTKNYFLVFLIPTKIVISLLLTIFVIKMGFSSFVTFLICISIFQSFCFVQIRTRRTRLFEPRFFDGERAFVANSARQRAPNFRVRYLSKVERERRPSHPRGNAAENSRGVEPRDGVRGCDADPPRHYRESSEVEGQFSSDVVCDNRNTFRPFYHFRKTKRNHQMIFKLTKNSHLINQNYSFRFLFEKNVFQKLSIHKMVSLHLQIICQLFRNGKIAYIEVNKYLFIF